MILRNMSSVLHLHLPNDFEINTVVQFVISLGGARKVKYLQHFCDSGRNVKNKNDSKNYGR